MTWDCSADLQRIRSGCALRCLPSFGIGSLENYFLAFLTRDGRVPRLSRSEFPYSHDAGTAPSDTYARVIVVQ
jgi:hypothetical protein